MLITFHRWYNRCSYAHVALIPFACCIIIIIIILVKYITSVDRSLFTGLARIQCNTFSRVAKMITRTVIDAWFLNGKLAGSVDAETSAVVLISLSFMV